MSDASSTSFYNQNAVTYTDTNPAGPADAPVTNENTNAPASQYKASSSNPSVTYIPGLIAIQPVPHQFLTGVSNNGEWNTAQPTFADISGIAASSQLPVSTATTFGTVIATNGAPNEWVQGITSGNLVMAQPGFSNLSGNINVSQMNNGSGASNTTFWRGDGSWANVPIISNATYTTLGTVEAIAQVAHEWVQYIDNTGIPHLAQPAFADLSAQIAISQIPAVSAILNMIDVTKSPYNADPTGVTDSTTAIQNALNAGVGIVVAPAGTYLTSGTLTIPDKVRFIGMGPTQTIINATAHNGTAITFAGVVSTGTGIEQMHVEGYNNAAATVDCVVVPNGGAPKIKQCIFQYGRYALNDGGVDAVYEDNVFRGFTANVVTVGANYWLRCGFDAWGTGGVYPTTNAFVVNPPYAGSTSGQHSMWGCDFSPGSIVSVLIQGSSTTTLVHFVECDLSGGSISFTAAAYVSLVSCDILPTGSFNCNSVATTFVACDNANAASPITILGTNVNVLPGCMNILAQTTALRATSASLAPTGTTSVIPARVMMGLAFAFTPATSGTCIFYLQGTGKNSVAGDGFNARLRYGTGTAPTNGAASTGTIAGVASQATVNAANGFSACNIFTIVSGLTVGTTYWLDAELGAITGGTATLNPVQVMAIEI